jgi:hypothetical protein
MSFAPPAVQLGAAEPLATVQSAHDQAQMQMQSELHEGAEQGIRLASLIHLESPQDSHVKTHSNDLGAGSSLPQNHPHDVVDQSQAAACVTKGAQDTQAIQLSSWPTMNGGDDLHQSKTFNYSIVLVASVVQSPSR